MILLQVSRNAIDAALDRCKISLFIVSSENKSYFCASNTIAMPFLELFLIAVGLSMDAFSVSVCKGLTTKRFSWRMALVCGLWFGFFQVLMPIIGYFLGAQFQEMIEAYDHWIAFGLLSLIGANMIREAIWGDKDSDSPGNDSLSFKTMFLLAIATSIDALAVGVSFACIQVQLWSSVVVIGLTTFLFSVLGVKIGNVFGSKYEKSASILGGIILILIGLKILLEHLGIISF